MKIVAIIPSRYGSSRFEGKPLAKICGKPMIQHTYSRAASATQVNDVFVATDDLRIADVVRDFGGKVIMTGDQNRSGTDRAAEAADKIGLASEDIVINVQGDQPMLDPRCLHQVIMPFFNEPSVEMTTLAFRIVNPGEITDPKDVKVTFDQQGFALYFSRSPIPFGRESSEVFDTYKHLGIYAYTRRFLDIFRNLPTGRLENIEKLEQLRAMEYGHKIRVILTEYDSPEVDIPEDIERIEKLIS